MKKRIEVSIGGQSYTIIAEDDSEYVEKVADYADKKLWEQKRSMTGSEMDAAVMSLLNLTDEYFKLRDSMDNLRVQIRDYLDDLTLARAEIAELKRELAARK